MSELHETIGKLKGDVSAAHRRVDRIEDGIKRDLENINGKLDVIFKELHKAEGMKTVWIFLITSFSGLIGSALTFLTQYYFGAK